MAKKASQIAELIAYVPKDDRALPPEEQSTFKLRPLTQAERLRAFDEMTTTEVRRSGDDVVRWLHDHSWSQARELVLEHLVDVQNFPAGAPVPWPGAGSQAQKEEYLAMIDVYLLYELGEELRTRASVSEAVKGFSGPAPT